MSVTTSTGQTKLPANAVVTYSQEGGGRWEVEAPIGASLMQIALSAGVRGIDGDCGGNCCCATCHVYVDPTRLGELPVMAEDENQMLDCTAAPRQPNSRLACQIRMTEQRAGLHVIVPAS